MPDPNSGSVRTIKGPAGHHMIVTHILDEANSVVANLFLGPALPETPKLIVVCTQHGEAGRVSRFAAYSEGNDDGAGGFALHLGVDEDGSVWLGVHPRTMGDGNITYFGLDELRHLAALKLPDHDEDDPADAQTLRLPGAGPTGLPPGR